MQANSFDLGGDQQPVPLVIVSNSQIVCEGLLTGLKQHLAIQPAAVVSAEADPPPAAHENLVVLIDSGIGEQAAHHWTQFYRSQKPPAHVIILEMVNEVQSILVCIEAGASGYVLRGASTAEIGQRIQQVRAGKTHCSPEVAAELFARVADGFHNRKRIFAAIPVELTPRELEVLYLIAQGYNNREIANQLVIAIHTVKHHVHHILKKLDCSHRREAAGMARQNGWFDNDGWQQTPTAKGIAHPL